jgi:hypothetical protein
MLKVTVTSNKDGKATLSLEDGQSFNISTSELPESLKEGDSLKMMLATPGLENQASKDLAKDILNNLINS